MIDLVPFSDRFLTDRYVSWLNDPETVKFSEQRHVRHTWGSCRDWLCADDRIVLAIMADGRHIGNVAADLDRPNRVADVSILLGEERGKGHGKEAFGRFCAGMLVNMRLVTCGTMDCNVPMKRIAWAAGMWELGRIRKRFLVDGREVDLVRYGRYA